MQEFDLKAIWDMEQQPAHTYYRSIEPKLMDLAKQRSKNILAQLKKNVLTESMLGILIWLVVLYLLSGHSYFTGVLIFVVLVYTISIYHAYQLFQQIKTINASDIRQSLTALIKIFKKAYNRSRILLYLFLPLGYIIGFMAGWSRTFATPIFNPDWQTALPIFMVSILLLISLIWFSSQKYMKWMYGRHIQRLEEILQSLISAEPKDSN